MSAAAATFGAVAMAAYVGHHVGDYWVQTDAQAKLKGSAGAEGVGACLAHVTSYVVTQFVMLCTIGLVLDVWVSTTGLVAFLLISGSTHYMADRREHGVMFWLIRKLEPLAGKASFMALGHPRSPFILELWGPCPSCEGRGAGGTAADESTGGRCWDCRSGGQLPQHTVINDNPQLATGAWALDQAWHIFWGVFVASLVAVAL